MEFESHCMKAYLDIVGKMSRYEEMGWSPFNDGKLRRDKTPVEIDEEILERGRFPKI